MGAAIATRHMIVESRFAAASDGAYHLHLIKDGLSAVGRSPSSAAVPKDIRNLLS